jgi:hypothetical protein
MLRNIAELKYKYIFYKKRREVIKSYKLYYFTNDGKFQPENK